MKYKNIYTGEIYEHTLKDIVELDSKGKRKTVKNVPHLACISSATSKSSEPFKVSEDWNKFNGFRMINHTV